MTLVCENCGSLALAITEQSYGVVTTFEAYECEECGDTGSLHHNDVTGTSFRGCLSRDLHDAETGYGTGGRP